MPFFVIVKRLPFFTTIVFIAACSHLRDPASNTSHNHGILLVDTALIRAAALNMPASTEAAYGASNNRLLWFDTVFLSPMGDSLLWAVKNADRFGLIPDDYHTRELDRLLQDSSAQGNIRIDMYLTDAFFTLRQHLRYGRLHAKTYERIDITEKVDSAGLRYLAGREVQLMQELKSLEPHHGSYPILRDSLSRMLTVTGRNHELSDKIERIKINMERWRWTPPFPSRRVQVNVPSFMLQVFEKDTIVLASKVIVGKIENATPLLESTITSFIIYPYWHVPRGIAIKELLPAIQYDSTYLEKHNYEVLDRDGNIVDPSTINWLMLYEGNFPYVLRQRDGAENALGVIKFVFNNPFNVYLHDTNSKRLFAVEKRALSHGCVRVQKARELARYLVKDDNIYITPDDLEQYLSLQQRYTIKIVKPIRLFIQYFTCEPLDGKLRFYGDVYKKDSLMMEALYHKEVPVGDVISGL